MAIDWKNIDAEKLLAALDQKTPVRVGALLDGKAAASWTTWSRDGLTADIEGTTHTTQVGLGLGGTVTLHVRNGEWRGTIDQLVDGSVHVEGRADGRLAAASLAASTINSAVVVTADSLPELWRTLHDLDLIGRDSAGRSAGRRARRADALGPHRQPRLCRAASTRRFQRSPN